MIKRYFRRVTMIHFSIKNRNIVRDKEKKKIKNQEYLYIYQMVRVSFIIVFYHKLRYQLTYHRLVCQSGKWLLCPHQVPRFDTPCPRCVGYTISMRGLKTNGACVGLGSLSSTFGLVVSLDLLNCTLGRGTMTAHVPFFF